MDFIFLISMNYVIPMIRTGVFITLTLLALNGCGNANATLVKKHMVVAANPHAAKAGLTILREGGSAVDAAIAIQMTLTLVEPQSSGIGGGAFMLHYRPNKESKRKGHIINAYDGRETAPSSANKDLFLDRQGKKIPWKKRKAGGKGVGVPGLLRMLELSHKHHGKLPWSRLFEPAIKLARKGFAVSPRLNALIKRDRHLKNFPQSRKFFYTKEGQPLPIGFRLQNLELANTLQEIAKKGASIFYTGPIARDIAKAVRNTHHLPAKMNVSDLASYQPKMRGVLCTAYRQWSICGMPPPTSGGIAVAQILKILEPFDFSRISITDLTLTPLLCRVMAVS